MEGVTGEVNSPLPFVNRATRVLLLHDSLQQKWQDWETLVSLPHILRKIVAGAPRQWIYGNLQEFFRNTVLVMNLKNLSA